MNVLFRIAERFCLFLSEKTPRPQGIERNIPRAPSGEYHDLTNAAGPFDLFIPDHTACILPGPVHLQKKRPGVVILYSHRLVPQRLTIPPGVHTHHPLGHESGWSHRRTHRSKFLYESISAKGRPVAPLQNLDCEAILFLGRKTQGCSGRGP